MTHTHGAEEEPGGATFSKLTWVVVYVEAVVFHVRQATERFFVLFFLRAVTHTKARGGADCSTNWSPPEITAAALVKKGNASRDITACRAARVRGGGGGTNYRAERGGPQREERQTVTWKLHTLTHTPLRPGLSLHDGTKEKVRSQQTVQCNHNVDFTLFWTPIRNIPLHLSTYIEFRGQASLQNNSLRSSW